MIYYNHILFLDLYYISRADNKIGLSLRQENGRMPVHQQINGVAYDNSYDQHSAGVVTDWNITGNGNAGLFYGVQTLLDHIDGWQKVYSDDIATIHLRKPGAMHTAEPAVGAKAR